MNLACTRTGLSSLQEASVGLGASLKEELFVNAGFVKADNNSFVDYV